MSFEVEWGSVTCAECGEDILPGQTARLHGEYRGRGENEYVHVNPPCGYVRPEDRRDCSHCGAQVGESCRDWNGFEVMPHANRMKP